jgi:hypothetical protein
MRRDFLESAKRSSGASATFEPLEQRSLMSASFSPLGTLTVTGTNGNDVITVSTVASGPFILTQVYENNVRTFNSPLLVSRVVVNALDGHDKVTINAALPAQLNGGKGNDSLTGGSRNDRLNGDAGDDVLSGSGGDDYLWGGAGSDRMYGGSGNDTIWAWDGLAGSQDYDIIDGGSGIDYADVNCTDSWANMESVYIHLDQNCI